MWNLSRWWSHINTEDDQQYAQWARPVSAILKSINWGFVEWILIERTEAFEATTSCFQDWASSWKACRSLTALSRSNFASRVSASARATSWRDWDSTAVNYIRNEIRRWVACIVDTRIPISQLGTRPWKNLRGNLRALRMDSCSTSWFQVTVCS